MTRAHGRALCCAARALSMVEAVVASFVVGVVFVAALNTVGASRAGMQRIQDGSRATMLAQDLMSEILSQAYEDADLPTITLGPEVTEILAANRSAFDDVDDYHGWTEMPPQYKDGTAMSDLSKWRRTVVVAWTNAGNLRQTELAGTGIKRITVTVAYSGIDVASLVAIRTSAWQDLAATQAGP